MTDEIGESRDWQDNEIRCETCRHNVLRACVHDRYARRIDRFFAWNQLLANEYLAHPHFEVRAIAAKYADVFRLPLMLRDPEPVVRRSVAERIGADWLMPMAADTDADVRLAVARRLPAAQLMWLQRDPDWRVRFEVAGRIDTVQLAELHDDPDPLVRERIAERLRDPSAGACDERARSA